MRYTDFARWQHEVFTADGSPAAQFGSAEIDQWRTQLADVPDEILVAPDRPRPTALSQDGVVADFAISPAVRAQLRAVGNRLGVTEFMALSGALTVALHRLGAGDDIVVGTPSLGRTDPGTQGLVGLLANMVAIRTDLTGGPLTVGRAAHPQRGAGGIRPRRCTAGARRGGGQSAPDRARNPLFQVMLHFRERAMRTPTAAPSTTRRR